MRTLIIGVLALAVLSQSASAQSAAEMNRDVGRVLTMMRQVDELANNTQSTINPLDRRDMSRRLRETVWMYNLLRSRLCAAGRNGDVSCGRAYMPGWLNEMPDISPMPGQLRDRVNDVRGEIMPFWRAVCDEARRAGGDDAYGRICIID